MFQTILHLLVILSVCAASKQFKVLQNLINPGDFGDSKAGAILSEPGEEKGIPAILDAFTLCMRFQLKVLGSRGFGDRGMMVNIGDM